ncbi:MAG TPA: TetR/AcrR family transcriptional regulator [Desulfatiglandales bacterium]|nr:TetR/AcrR family transcriptional regulator [Desulfatiglandales bacterium]
MNLKYTIIHESLKLFSLKGFLSTSIGDIMKAANTSKGGLYNHFGSKEDLFYAVLSEARKIWREKTLYKLDQADKPTEKLIRLLMNYRDRYLKDADDFPGGCIFVTLSVELDDQRPHLARELNEGYVRLKAMIRRLLDQAKEVGQLSGATDTQALTEMIFSGMLGASVMYGMDKSSATLDRTINSLIEHLRRLAV